MSLLNGLSAAGYGLAQVGMEGVKASFEQEKIKLADQLAGVREAATDTRREDIRRAGKQADIDLETSEETVAKKGRAASGLINATTPAEVSRSRGLAQSTIDVNTDPANVQKAIDKLNLMAPAEAKVKRDAIVAELEAKSTPEALRAARQIAQATHIESAGSLAQADLARLSIKDKERAGKLQDEYLMPGTSKERKDAIHTELNVLAGKRDDLIKLRVKVGEDEFGKPIMEDVLVDAKTRKRVDIGGTNPGSQEGAKAGRPALSSFGGGPAKPKKEIAEPKSGLLNSTRPTSATAPVSNWGTFSSWSDIEAGIRAGDQGAINYATERLSKPVSFGVNPPDSVRQALEEATR